MKKLLAIIALLLASSIAYADNVNVNLRAKNSDGNWVDAGVDSSGNLKVSLQGGAAPTDATYITQTANSTLTAEQPIAALSSGILRGATTTGVITSLTDSAGIAANISDEVGTGVMVFGTSPTFTTSIALNADPADTGAIRLSNADYIFSEASPAGTDVSVIGVDTSEVVQIGASGASGVTITPATTITGHTTFEGVTSTGATGSGKLVYDGTPTLVTPVIGAATGTSATLNLFNANNNAVTASGNAATVPVTSSVTTVTNNSAATLTITITTAAATNRQKLIVCILDATAAAQTITWVNTEDSTVAAPTTSNGSTSLPLTVGFMFNTASGKWRTVAKA